MKTIINFFMNHFYITLVLLLFSCTNSNKNDSTCVKPLGFMEITDFNAYVDEVILIQLETSIDGIIVQPQKVLITPSQEIIILDVGKVLMFDSSGKFLRKVTDYGKGPGELTHINDIALCLEFKKILVLDPYNNVFTYLLEDGSFIDKKNFSSVKGKNYDAIAPSKDEGLFLFSTTPNNPSDFKRKHYCLSEYNKNGEFIAEYLNRNDFLFHPMRITKSFDCGYFIRPLESEKVLIKLNNGILEENECIDFEDMQVPNKLIFSFGGSPWEHIQSYIQSPYFKIPMGFIDTKNIMYFYAAGPNGEAYEYIFSKETKKGFYWKDNDSHPVRFLFSDSECFYGFYWGNKRTYDEINSSGILQSDLIISPLQKLLKSKSDFDINYSENPLMFKIKLKPF